MASGHGYCICRKAATSLPGRVVPPGARSAAAERGIAVGTRREGIPRRIGNETLAHRSSGQLRPVLSVELLHDVLEVELDRVLADTQLARNLAVALADGDELEDFQLSIGQALRRPGATARHPEELVDDSSGRGRRDGRLAARHPLQHGAELGRFKVLQQIAMGTRLDGTE